MGSDQEVKEIDELEAHDTTDARLGTPMDGYLSDIGYRVPVPRSRELVPALRPRESVMIPHIYPAFRVTGCHGPSPPVVMHVDQAAPWWYGKRICLLQRPWCLVLSWVSFFVKSVKILLVIWD